jgi:hypothetical protein
MHGVATPGRRMTWPNRSGGQLNPTPRHAGTIRPRLDYFVMACTPKADRYASGHGEIEVIDSELRLLVAIRHMVREQEDQAPVRRADR